MKYFCDECGLELDVHTTPEGEIVEPCYYCDPLREQHETFERDLYKSLNIW